MNQRRVFLAARATAEDKRLLVFDKIIGHRGFYANLVDGINHKIKRPSEQFGQVFFGHKIFDFNHFAGRVDLQDALVQGAHFGFAEIIGKRVQLAVDIRFGHVVQINQG